MFDPTKITTVISLAAASIWAVCYVRNSSRLVVLCTLLVTLAALGTAAGLEWTQHVDVCAKAPVLQLNEVCAEGKECDGGKDFIEFFNPNSSVVTLGCYAVGDQRSARDNGTRLDAMPVLLPEAEISAGGVRAWNEDQLGFRLSWKKGDQVVLYKLNLSPGRKIGFVRIEQVLIDESKSYLYRSPDGNEWKSMSHEDVSKGNKHVGSFEKVNTK